MKKYLFCTVLVLNAAWPVFAQDISRFLSDFSTAENVQVVRPDINSIKKGIGNKITGLPFSESVDSVEIFLSEKKENPQIGDNIKNMIQSLKDDDIYKTLMTVNDDEDLVRIVARKENEVFTELIVFVSDKDETVVVKISGKMNESDIDKLMRETAFN
jgi:hypothetical protein